MIRINLLPVREARRQANVRKQGILLGLGAVAGVVVSMGLNLTVSAQAKAKQAEIVAATAELDKLKETKAEVERYRQERDEIDRKLTVIARLEENRTGPVRILDDIATRIPERMWLQELSLKGGELSIRGVSIDAEIVAEFLTVLTDSEWVRDVELEETTLKEEGGLKLNIFRVRGQTGRAVPETPANPAGRRGK